MRTLLLVLVCALAWRYFGCALVLRRCSKEKLLQYSRRNLQAQQASKHRRSDVHNDVLLRDEEDSDELVTATDRRAAARNAALQRSRIARARAPRR